LRSDEDARAEWGGCTALGISSPFPPNAAAGRRRSRPHQTWWFMCCPPAGKVCACTTPAAAKLGHGGHRREVPVGDGTGRGEEGGGASEARRAAARLR